MLGVSVITLDYKQWKPPVSYYLKKKTSLKVTHSSTKKGGRSNLDHSRNQVTTAIRKGRKPRDDSCPLSSSSWVECHLLLHSLLSLSAPDSKSGAKCPFGQTQASPGQQPADGELSTLTFTEGKAWDQTHTQQWLPRYHEAWVPCSLQNGTSCMLQSEKADCEGCPQCWNRPVALRRLLRG